LEFGATVQGGHINLPEVEGNVEIELKLCDQVLRKMLELKETEIMKACDGKHYYTAVRKNGEIYIMLSEVVVLEFELSDYAPEQDEL
jgi:hypothetical protein